MIGLRQQKVRVTVDIDETRCDDASGAVDRMCCFEILEVPDVRDGCSGHRDVAANRCCARAIDHHTTLEFEIRHAGRLA